MIVRSRRCRDWKQWYNVIASGVQEETLHSSVDSANTLKHNHKSGYDGKFQPMALFIFYHQQGISNMLYAGSMYSPGMGMRCRQKRVENLSRKFN